jgi:hypothetical protein
MQGTGVVYSKMPVGGMRDRIGIGECASGEQHRSPHRLFVRC